MMTDCSTWLAGLHVQCCPCTVIENDWCNVYLFQDAEHQNREACERLEQEKQELQARLQEQLEAEQALQLRLEALQSDGDMTQKQLAALQSHLHDLQPNNVIDTKIDIDNFKSTDSTGDFHYLVLQPPEAVSI